MAHLRRLSLVEQTANLLREGLGHGRWRGQLPGVVRLAEELGVSTHALRAALQLMETEGLIALSEDGRGRHLTAKGTPDCGTLCCRLRGMDALLHAVRSSSSSPRQRMKSSAPHPAEPELPWARAELRALRTAA